MLAPYHEDERGIVAARKARDLPSCPRAADIDERIARPVAFGPEGGHAIAEIFLEAPLGTEGDLAHRGMETVGADDEIDVARPA